MLLLCYTVKHFFYILQFQWYDGALTTCQTGAFATDIDGSVTRRKILHLFFPSRLHSVVLKVQGQLLL